jgi:hypothetical protein
LKIFFNNEKYAWFTVEQSEKDSVGTYNKLYVKIKQNFLTEKTSVLMSALISFIFNNTLKSLILFFTLFK